MIPWRNHWSNPWFCSHNADCISGFMKENLIPCFLERLDLNQPNGSGSACLAMNSLPYSYYASVAKPKSGSGSMPMCMHTAFSFSGFSLGCPGVFVRIWSRWGEKPDQMGKTFHGSLWSIHTAYASMKNCKWGNPEQFIMPGNSELRVGGHYFKWNFSRKIKIKTKNNNNRTENQGMTLSTTDHLYFRTFCLQRNFITPIWQGIFMCPRVRRELRSKWVVWFSSFRQCLLL